MSNYTQLGFVKQTDGENTGTWGDVLNENLIDLLDDSIGGYVEVSVASGNVTLAFADGTADNNGRHAVIKFTGSPGTTRTVTFPDKQINYFIVNGSDSSVICTSGTGAATVTIPTGLKDVIYIDGSDEVHSMFSTPHLSSSGNFTVDATTDIILDADGGDIFFKDGGTTFGSATNTSGNLIIKSGTTTALTFSGANVTVAGDLTVSGDDITMGTNTAGNVLVADGTNFNSVAVGDLSEISTVASDDVIMAVDTSGGGLKKITRANLVSGLAAGTMSNVVDDTSPQLGGNLDMNGADIVTTSNATIDLAPNGTGTVVVRGNTNSGRVVFNCESNSHGQTLASQPHSAGVTNTLLLPAGANSTLVSLVSTDTLTNKTLTSPKVNEDVAVTSTATELNLLDGVTATTAELNILDGVTSTAAELNILDGVTSTATELNIMDGDTSASSTTLADADRMVINDNGTMKQVAVTDMTTYINSNASFASKGFATAMAIAL
jgi:hypothetical protein